jgi:flagellar basal body-associated protein FliL
MSTEQELQELIKSYRYTVIALCVIIILTMVIFAGTLLVYVPALISNQRAEEAPVMIKQALAEFFAENEVMITEP